MSPYQCTASGPSWTAIGSIWFSSSIGCVAPDSVRLLCRAAQRHACAARGRPHARRRAGRQLPSGVLAAQPSEAIGTQVQAFNRGREENSAVDGALGHEAAEARDEQGSAEENAESDSKDNYWRVGEE